MCVCRGGVGPLCVCVCLPPCPLSCLLSLLFCFVLLVLAACQISYSALTSANRPYKQKTKLLSCWPTSKYLSPPRFPLQKVILLSGQPTLQLSLSCRPSSARNSTAILPADLQLSVSCLPWSTRNSTAIPSADLQASLSCPPSSARNSTAKTKMFSALRASVKETTSIFSQRCACTPRKQYQFFRMMGILEV